MLTTSEKAADWLLSGLELRSTLFHVGQYCGDYRASTAGHQRARFCRQFAEVSGQPPAQFLAMLRMKVAAEMLRQGASALDAAEQVGYQSDSAFAQTFRRVTGLHPGACRKERSASAAHIATSIENRTSAH
jgi:AraC-like DNA-binding protein